MRRAVVGMHGGAAAHADDFARQLEGAHRMLSERFAIGSPRMSRVYQELIGSGRLSALPGAARQTAFALTRETAPDFGRNLATLAKESPSIARSLISSLPVIAITGITVAESEGAGDFLDNLLRNLALTIPVVGPVSVLITQADDIGVSLSEDNALEFNGMSTLLTLSGLTVWQLGGVGTTIVGAMTQP